MKKKKILKLLSDPDIQEAIREIVISTQVPYKPRDSDGWPYYEGIPEESAITQILNDTGGFPKGQKQTPR